jgi:hypothetical protein
VHLVGFIIRIYHDARSSECQTTPLSNRFTFREMPLIQIKYECEWSLWPIELSVRNCLEVTLK